MAVTTQDEWRAFLREPARPAMLVTVRPDGRPVPVTPARVIARKKISD